MNKYLFSFLFIVMIVFFTGCYRVSENLQPQINYSMQDKYLKQLPSPFSELTLLEKQQDWGKEYLIGISFAKSLDFYRAITAFRRAEILAPATLKDRKLEMQYEILLCYYLGRRFQEVDQTFAQSGLAYVNDQFPAFQDLLIILYDTYQNLQEEDKAAHILQLIHEYYPELYEQLLLSSALTSANFPEICAYTEERSDVKQLLNAYEYNKKSIRKARWLNTIIPGAGYLYVGQRQTALTAFLVNGLFIAAAVHFFQKGEIAAGIITTSFEAGWYFGGIYGAAEEAKFYNERLYERMVTPYMNQQKLFPGLMLRYAF